MPFSELLHSSSFTISRVVRRSYLLYLFMWEWKSKIYGTVMSQVHFIMRNESQEETEHCRDFINKYFKSNVAKKNFNSILNSNPNRKYLNVVLRVSQSSPHKTDIWSLQCLLSLFVIRYWYCLLVVKRQNSI